MLVFISWCYKCPLKYFHKCFFFQFTAKITDFLYSSCFAPQWASMLLLSGSNVPL